MSDFEVSGRIAFGRDIANGNLCWQVVFEVPLPSLNGDFTIFQKTGVVIPTTELTPAQEYRGAIQAIAREFEIWQKMSEHMWQEQKEEVSG